MFQTSHTQDNKENDFDLHLQLSFQIENTYKNKDIDSGAIQNTIDLCWVQINMADRAKSDWIKQEKEIGISDPKLPTHKGYTQLCIILEKDKKFDEVIDLANRAKKEGWMGDWDKRIQRCESKMLHS